MTLTAVKKIPIVQGEYAVSRAEGAVISTVLGSCVAACIYDPVAKIGGMNHFLLPGDPMPGAADQARRYGVYLMEMLINSLYHEGALKKRMQVKLFGGARVLDARSDTGARNSEFARNFISNEGLVLVSESLGGFEGRRVEFEPVTGRARQKFIGVAAPEPEPRKLKTQLETAGDVDFF